MTQINITMDIKDISSRIRNERQLKAVTGLSLKQFCILFTLFEKLLNLQQEENKKDKIKPNNGKEGALKKAPEKLLFVLFYLKCYPSYDQFGFTFDMSGSSAHTWLFKLMPIFIKTLTHFNIFPKTKFNTPAEIKETFKGFDTLIIDATERAIQRPQDNKEQKNHYSGKKKDIPLKIQLLAR
jgi:hypothetical protein